MKRLREWWRTNDPPWELLAFVGLVWLLALANVGSAIVAVARAGDGGGTGKRSYTPGALSGKRCTTDPECDLNQICLKWRSPDDGVRCVAGCRGDRDCRQGSFCDRPRGCESDGCRLCLRIDWSGP